jgi:tetratricopeptide (TPR) repeat protein
MSRLRCAAAWLALLALVPASRAGLYYSGEPFAELPSQWRGFLLDQRALRQIAVKPAGGVEASPLRVKYEEEAAKLEKKARDGKLSADEAADLGALYVRLGDAARAVDVLRAAQREHPDHFHVVANLGTAWQLMGDLDQAAACLQDAVKLAPGKLEKAEEYQLKLVRLRQKQGKDGVGLDDLFGVHYQGDGDRYEAGKIAEAERKKLPPEAVAVLQQLALWLPADARLLWQLAEVANATGDVRTAASIMDGCVTEFGLRTPELKEHRQATRAAADELAKKSSAGDDAKATHELHVGGQKPRSTRPLLNRVDLSNLPAVTDKGVNPLPWAVLAATTLDKKFKPTFHKHLEELDGKQVVLTGFMQPLGDEQESAAFMLIEYPVGCWYCEMPEATGIVLVELPKDKTKAYTRGLIKITGKLTLNGTDPENFLYTIGNARVSEAD